MWVLFPQCIRNQEARGGTNSAKKRVSFSCTPLSARVLKCSSCPCTKPMPQTEKLRLGEVESQSWAGQSQACMAQPPEQCPPSQFLQSPFQVGQRPLPELHRACQGSGLSQQHQLPMQSASGPCSEHSAHTNDSISPQPQRQVLCHPLSPSQSYGGS